MEARKKRKKVYIGILLLCIFTGSLFLLSFISYSDGDDTFFQIYTSEMGFLEYVTWRYETWSGRVIAEALLYAFFRMDLWGWRIVNAIMLAALPLLLAVLQKKVNSTTSIALSFTAAIMIFFLLDIRAFGYAGIWITGSMNYLWPDVCGIIALCAVCDFLQEKKIGVTFLPVILCAMVAAMSSEQMGAVLIAFELLCITALMIQKKRVPAALPGLTIISIVSFAISSMAPGNALRVAESIEVYLPQFRELEFTEKAFMLMQWLISSFANENAAFLAAIWIGILLILNQKRKEKKDRKIYLGMGFSVVGILAVLLSKMGFTKISDLGLDLSSMMGCVEQVPRAKMLTSAQWMAMVFWSMALIITFILLWVITERNGIVLLTYLGAIASEAVMILSPTIYSSGARVFFLTGVMLMFLILVLADKLKKEKLGVLYTAILIVLGMAHFLLQIPTLLSMMGA